MSDAQEELKAALAGRYTLLGVIGTGGMAVVHLAHDERYDRRVAIKVLRPELASSIGSDRFLREIRIAAQLNHPHILPVLDSGEAHRLPYYVMPYVEDESLRDRLRRENRLSVGDALVIAREVADAIAYAHAHGVVHRDIKPENILLRSGHATVADFGVARALTAAAGDVLTQTGISVGTPMYMSPEQASGTGHIDERTDVYALGVVLYEVLAGELPFTGSPLTALAQKLEPARGVRRLRSQVPARIEQAISRALAPEAENRFPTMREFASALAPEAASPRRSGRRVASIVAVAAVLVIAVASTNGSVRARAAKALGLERPAAVTIAIMPFTNLGGLAESAYFTDGMAAELITKLSRIEGVLVAAQSSTQRFKGKSIDVRQIGESLGVQYVLEGSVRQQRDRVRISVDLLDARTGFRRWSDSFDRDLRDVFALQDEAALRIAQALDLQLTAQQTRAVMRRYTQDVDAYDAYLQGRAVLETATGSPDDRVKLDAAEQAFRRALARDSTYALAISGLAQVEAIRHWARVDTSALRLKYAEELARRALSIDASLGTAHIVLGDIHGARQQWPQAVDAFRRGLRLDPQSAYGWEELAWALLRSSPPQLEQAEHAARESVRLNPDWYWSYYQLGDALRRRRRYNEATDVLKQALQLKPDFERALHLMAHVQLEMRQYRDALARFAAETSSADRGELRWDIAAAYAGLGEAEKSLAHLSLALARGYRPLAAFDTMPAFATLRNDARFGELLRKYR